LPEKQVNKNLRIDDLLQQWHDSNAMIIRETEKLTLSEWMERHGLVSAEDFIKEPKRNRLNVFISRLGHQRYHLGQLAIFSPIVA